MLPACWDMRGARWHNESSPRRSRNAVPSVQPIHVHSTRRIFTATDSGALRGGGPQKLGFRSSNPCNWQCQGIQDPATFGNFLGSNFRPVSARLKQDRNKRGEKKQLPPRSGVPTVVCERARGWGDVLYGDLAIISHTIISNNPSISTTILNFTSLAFYYLNKFIILSEVIFCDVIVQSPYNIWNCSQTATIADFHARTITLYYIIL